MIEPHPFWFLRHGETDWNARNLSQGSVDIPLNATGVAQADRAALALENRGIRTIVSSPLGRARHTANTVAAALGLPVAIDPDLREVSFGEMEGQDMGGAWFVDWVEGRVTPQDAEPFAALQARAVAAVNRALALDAPVLVVAHGALFRAVRDAMGLERNVRTGNAVPFFCEPGTPWQLTPAGGRAPLPRPPRGGTAPCGPARVRGTAAVW